MLVAALFLATAATAPNWKDDLLDLGWKGFGESDAVVSYYRDAKAGSQFPRVWRRFEYQNAPRATLPKVLSVVELEEVDCKEHRLHILQQTTYSDHNLQGESQLLSGGPWQYVTPGTLGEQTELLACLVSDPADYLGGPARRKKSKTKKP